MYPFCVFIFFFILHQFNSETNPVIQYCDELYFGSCWSNLRPKNTNLCLKGLTFFLNNFRWIVLKTGNVTSYWFVYLESKIHKHLNLSFTSLTKTWNRIVELNIHMYFICSKYYEIGLSTSYDNNYLKWQQQYSEIFQFTQRCINKQAKTEKESNKGTWYRMVDNITNHVMTTHSSIFIVFNVQLHKVISQHSMYYICLTDFHFIMPCFKFTEQWQLFDKKFIIGYLENLFPVD